jgi:ectoine hydroxylase-related dioxygenase (phytanoyl-CoA dioxygenase family)
MKYKSKTISSNPGDIIFVDFNTLHKSGINTSNKTRVGVIMRFGEKLDPKEMLN